jgi:hypothetical protein
MLRRRRCATFLASAAALMVGGRALATTTFFATLTNAQEGPTVIPTNTDGSPRFSSGTATFVLSDDQQSMTMHAVIVGLDVDGTQTPSEPKDNLVAAHIHAGANNPPTTNGVVWGFFGTPFNDNNPNDFVLTKAPAGSVGGTFDGKWDNAEGNGTTLAQQLPNIFAGRAYINFHSSQFGGGEIRGVLLAPEPASLGILGGTLGALALRRRRAVR